MNFRVLGSDIEYLQAAKRLEEIADARANTPEALEYKELLKAFIRYEREILQLNGAFESKKGKAS